MLISRRIRRRDEGGIVAVNLALFLGFALYAVVQLTRTTLAAQQIDERVVVITKEVAPIDQNLNEVPKLDLTNDTAAKIRAAADPLSGDAQDIINAAQSINGTVKDIAGNVGSISASVRTIGGNASSLQGTVKDIQGGVAGINHRVDVIINLANAIRGDLTNVNGVVGGSGNSSFNGSKTINAHARQICLDLGAGPCV